MNSSTNHALAHALGVLLAGQETPRVVVLPHDLPWDEVAYLVRTANEHGPAVAGGYSHLVHDDVPPVEVSRISSAQATAYREGPRLLVVRGSALAHASNEVFRPLLDASWPDPDHETVDLADVAGVLVGLLDGGGGRELLETQILQGLRVARALHMALGSASMQWNTAWWLHATVAVQAIANRLPELPADALPEDVIPDLVRAAFGIPLTPAAGEKAVKDAGTDVAAGLVGPWASEDDAAGSAKLLAVAREDFAGLLDGVSFSGLDDKVQGNDSPALAWVKFLAEHADVAEAVAHVPVKLFAEPTGSAKHVLEVWDANGLDLTWSKSLQVARTDLVAPDRIESEALRVVLPTLTSVSEVSGSLVRVNLSPSRFRFEGEVVAEEGAVVLVGRVVLNGAAAVAKFEPRLVRLSLELPAGDVLEGRVAPNATTALLLAHPTLPTLSVRADGRGTPQTFVMEQDWTVELAGRKGNDLLLVTEVEGSAPEFNGEAWRPMGGLPWLHAREAGTQGFSVTLGERNVVALRTQDARSARWSPLIALLDGAETYAEGEPQSAAHEVRGVIEQDLAELLGSGLWREGVGHYVMSSDDRTDPGLAQAPVPWARTEARLAAPHKWSTLITPPVPQELLQSEEAAKFREAFDGLGLQQLPRAGGSAGPCWPSLINYAQLWETEALDAYLEAFVALQERARQLGSQMGVFWAAYPFSVAVWRPGSPSAVLLSPWHPVRLAWLAAVSSGVASEASDEVRRRFAGVIEGWNFPAVGPTETPGAAMLAVPAGNGPEQLFVGWSTMVLASNQLDLLRMPEWAGGHRSPVTTMSGLNGTAVRKALRDFQRANPHVATLAVDLAMASEGPRLDEIDSGVLDEVAQWVRDGRGQLGGLRVHDSLKRSGPVPVEQVQDLSDAGIAVTWQRYGELDAAPEANLRVIQDAGQMVRAEQVAQPAASGAVGPVPYRRIETPGPVDQYNASLIESRPLLNGEPANLFEAALHAVESPISGNGLVVKSTFQTAVGSSPADWTVMGDSSLNPAAMARLVAQNPTELALWEWCPPMLSSGGGETVLESRPYLSVARMPTALTQQLDTLLQDWSEEVRVQPKDVLGTLGARGVGLASLIAIGGSHASGAMGFYVALRLLEQLSTAPDLHLVLPMDACAEYLTALAMSDEKQDDQRRADLLLVRITNDEVVLSPVEVKYYKPGGPLPHARHSELSEALGQLSTSMGLLERLEERALEQGDESLWNAALGALLEVGVRLSSSTEGAPEGAAKLLERASSGKLAVRVGRPVLCFFKRQSGDSRLERVRVDGLEHLQIAADPSLAMGFLEGEEALAKLVDELLWATHPGQEPVPETYYPAHATEVEELSGADEQVAEAVASDGEKAARVGLGVSPPASTSSLPVGVQAQGKSPDLVFGDAAGAVQPVVEEPRSPVPDLGQVSSPKSPSQHSGTGTSSPFDGLDSGTVEFPGVKFPVGMLTDAMGHAPAEFWPANTALTQLNVGVVGNLGTGKTQLLKSLVTQLRRTSAARQPAPATVLILDYKGDFTGREFLDAVGGTVLKPHEIPVNYFDLDGPYTPMAAVRRAGSFNDVLGQIFNIGPKQQNALRKVVVERFKSQGFAPTIAEVLQDYVENHSDSDSVVGVLEGWVMGEVFSDDRSRIKKFSDLMEGGVVVLDLLELGADQASKNALVALFLNLYYEYVVKLPKWPYEGKDPQLRRLNSFLLVDEATNIMSYKFDALESLLLQGREFGAGVILSSQYLSHFKSNHIDYAQALRSWFVHSVPNVTSAQLAMLGLQEADASVAARITNLPTHHCLYSSLGYQGRFMRGTPFFELMLQGALE